MDLRIEITPKEMADLWSRATENWGTQVRRFTISKYCYQDWIQNYGLQLDDCEGHSLDVYLYGEYVEWHCSHVHMSSPDYDPKVFVVDVGSKEEALDLLWRIFNHWVSGVDVGLLAPQQST